MYERVSIMVDWNESLSRIDGEELNECATAIGSKTDRPNHQRILRKHQIYSPSGINTLNRDARSWTKHPVEVEC